AEAKSLNNGANPIVGLVEQAIMVNTTGKGFNENETIISGSFDATGGDLDSRVAGIIEDSAIKYLHQHDSKSGQNNYTLSYLYDNEPLLSTIILTDVDRMALQIPEVSEQT